MSDSTEDLQALRKLLVKTENTQDVVVLEGKNGRMLEINHKATEISASG